MESGEERVDFQGCASLAVEMRRRQIDKEVFEVKTGLFFVELPYLMAEVGRGVGEGWSWGGGVKVCRETKEQETKKVVNIKWRK